MLCMDFSESRGGASSVNLFFFYGYMIVVLLRLWWATTLRTTSFLYYLLLLLYMTAPSLILPSLTCNFAYKNVVDVENILPFMVFVR